MCTAVRGKEIYLDTDYHVGFFLTFMNVLYIFGLLRDVVLIIQSLLVNYI